MGRLHNIPDIYYRRPAPLVLGSLLTPTIYSYSGSGGLSFGGGASSVLPHNTFALTGAGGIASAGSASLAKTKAFRSSATGTISFAWDAVVGATGYKLYYGTVSGAPYLGTGALQGTSPIDVGNVLTFTLTGLNIDQTYYFSLTAYSVSRVSGFATEIVDRIISNVFSGSGSALTSKFGIKSFAGTGGVTVSGSLQSKLIKQFLTAGGGILSGGSAITSKIAGSAIFLYSGAGGLVTSGIAVLKKTFQHTPKFTGFITLAWDVAAGATGYKLYYDQDSGAPYTGTGATEGNSPIDVGNVTTFTLHNLQVKQTYFFAVTAYSLAGESGYSNEYSTTILVGIFSISGAALLKKTRAFSTSGIGVSVFSGVASQKLIKVLLASGEIDFAGAATTSKISNTQQFSYSGSGGIVLSGAALLVKIKAYIASGAAFFSGFGLLKRSKSYQGTGTVQSAGSAVPKMSKSLTASGGLFTGGSAGVVQVGQGNFIYVGAGGVVLSGSALLKLIREFAATGGVILAGSGLLKTAKLAIGSGALLISGNAVLSEVKKVLGSGAVVSSGAAGLEFIPITPGHYVYVSRDGGVLISGQAVESRTLSVLGSGVLQISGAAIITVRNVQTLEIPGYRIIIIPMMDRELEVFES